MNSALQLQFRRLDRALLALLDERVELALENGLTCRDAPPSIEDLLRRHDGPTDAASIRAFFEVVAVARTQSEVER